jgi:hypothetical protein
LRYQIEQRPSWAIFNPTTGELVGTPGPESIGYYSGIVISVSDGSTTVALPQFQITVEPGSQLGTALLTWTPPTTRADGSEFSDLSGYLINYGTRSGNYNRQINVPDAGLTSYLVEQLYPGTYFFCIKAYDSSTIESTCSNEVSKAIQN